ncbi:MAG: hypothetical protein GY803_18150, partial [Chloroflexi bacterium]|nr:hypothetical protein [Chloroflexota bacterium]
AVSDGPSLERLPGGEAGNDTNTFDNSADFIANAAPNPQNSGSPMTPFPEDTLAIRIDAPDSATPAQTFEYQISVENFSSIDAANVLVSVPVADGFTVLALPDGGVVEDGRIQFTIPHISQGAIANAAITLESPAVYVDTLIGGYYAEADDLVRAYGPLRMLTMSGGSISIATARTLEGATVSVEGVATMYTGGLYAGSTGTKFYLEDESGGVQIFVPGGIDDVVVAIGDRVRATGAVTPYRDSIEIIPDDYATDIEIMESGAEWEPTEIAIGDYALDDPVIGLLTMIEGTAVRIEEFTYSYEMDIANENGNVTLLYIDKLTNISAEPYDVGRQYRIVGISEFYSGQYQIYPRLQSDVAEVFPPILAIEMHAPNSVAAGGMMDVTVTVYNHTDAPMTNLQIRHIPPQEATLDSIVGGDIFDDGTIFWNIAELAADGGTASVSYRAVVDASEGSQIVIEPATVVADQWPDAAATAVFATFVGDGVPIWALQGDGPASPYVRTEATTVGVVTAVFPNLGGFWLQTLEPDGDTATSDGIFVLLDEALRVEVAEGDLLEITGRVREISGQTTLHPQMAGAIVKHGDGYTGAIEPIVYDPPQDPSEAAVYMESLEGMLVKVEEIVIAVAPTTKYGETVLAADKWGVEQVRRGEEVGFLIFTDDGSSETHLDQSTLPYVVTQGDYVTNLVGPLAFTFDNYKIELMEEIVRVGEERPLPSLPETGPNQFSIASFNVENFFDNRDPHPSDPPRPTKDEYALKQTKIAAAI